MIDRLRRQYSKSGKKPLFYFGKYMKKDLEIGYSFEAQEFAGNNNVVASGSSGTGKTVTATCLADQIGRGLYFDPKGGAEDVIKEFGFTDWKFFDTQSKRIRLNIAELKESSVQVLLTQDTAKERFMIEGFKEFFALPEGQKRFSVLRKILQGKGQYHLANDLELIFAKRGGMSLGEFMSMKVCWNVRGLSPFHRAFGLLIKMIYDNSYENKSRGKYFLAIDDAQTHATSKTSLGKAFALSFSEGRFFNVVNILIGTHTSFIDYGIKVNTDLAIYFPSRKESKKLEQLGADFKDVRMVNLRKAHSIGNCFVGSETMPFFVGGREKRFDEPVPVYFDVYGYLERKETEVERQLEYVVNWSR